MLKANNIPNTGKEANNGKFIMFLETQSLFGIGITPLKYTFRKCV